jgi:hypothetical protein
VAPGPDGLASRLATVVVVSVAADVTLAV